MFQGKENKNENTEIKKKDEMVMIKADTGLTYTNLSFYFMSLVIK